jgi:hypothetical protein
MAVCMLGPGHDKILNNYAKRFHTRVGGHRQVYQVDRVDRNALCGSSGLLSSMTSYIVLASLTLSLQIWDPISTRISSRIFVNAVPLKSNIFQWLTRGPTARLSAPTV